ncbi:glycosyltransferase [Syntrophomonas palmitatica]|uniref:glycosyltransferase n=1 Tax=Syntrophomonas palmitatica TaxID=402877 RepID=UPI0006CF4A94|nr:glycosyltransferase [Syntrophomonas palmitatica]
MEIISITNHDQPAFQGEIALGLWEHRIPKTQKHQAREWELEKTAGVPVTDVAMPMLSQYTPAYRRVLEQHAKNAEIIVISHPYLVNEGLRLTGKHKLIYEAHNVEYDLKKRLLKPDAKKLIDEVFRVEKLCCDKASLIMTCSEEDSLRLAELYNVNSDKFVVVPNGVDTAETPFTSLDQRYKNKKKLGLENETLVLFMGSWHPPNLEACEEIFKMARQLPEVKFLLMGSQCLAFENRNIPSNVGLLGIVDDDEKRLILSIVDIALNPMQSGSGTNLKMFDYMAAGIPIISTEFGARGIDIKKHLIISNVEKMPERIFEIMQDNQEKRKQIIHSGYKLIRENFDWQRIASILNQKLESLNII